MFKAHKFTFKFNASHYFDKRENLHSHTFFVKLYIYSKGNEFVLYDDLERVFEKFFSNYKGCVLNDLTLFESVTPTIENMGKIFYVILDNVCSVQGLKLLRLEIGDGPLKSFCLGEKIIVGTVHNEINENDFKKLAESLNLSID